MTRFGLIVPTLNAGALWKVWLDALCSQECFPKRLLLIDSGSTDETVSMAERCGFLVSSINRADFNHGGTRQSALDMLADVEIVVYLTQDAVLCNSLSLCNIVHFFEDDSIAAVCGRQLPRKGGGPIGSHARVYNYDNLSFVRTKEDIKTFGLKTAFISNSFAAYRVSALRKVGGFPSSVIFGEDMYVAAKLLLEGYKVAYAADACVYHSHDYTLLQEFRRYFDMGVFHACEPWIRETFGSAEGEGLNFVRSEIRYLLKYAFWLIPEALMRKLLAYLGFRLGLAERYWPLWLKRKLAMNSGYFEKVGSGQ